MTTICSSSVFTVSVILSSYMKFKFLFCVAHLNKYLLKLFKDNPGQSSELQRCKVRTIKLETYSTVQNGNYLDHNLL